jgi:hypothetical protein
MKVTILLLLSTAAVSFAQRMFCPKIDCVLYDADMEPNNLCMQHEGINSENHKIKLRNCNDIPN